MYQTKTYKISPIEAEVLLNQLSSKGWGRISDPNPYMQWKIKTDGGMLSMYTSGKLVFQGDETHVAEIENVAGSANSTSDNSRKDMGQVTGFASLNSDVKLWGKNYIGCDEAGKGEFLGPIVAGACYLPKGAEQKIIDMGVQDSKKVTDKKVKELAKQLEEICKFSVAVIMPEEFNVLIAKEKNIAIVLSIAHSRAVADLIGQLTTDESKETTILVDKFSKRVDRLKNVMKQNVPHFENYVLHEEEKGERYPAVAAASIFARANYLYRLEEIEAKYSVKLPRGYGEVVQFCRNFADQYGREELNKMAKMSFKTASEI